MTAFELLLVVSPGIGELYATRVYPHISAVMSRIASPFRVSLQIFVIAAIVLSFIAIIIIGCRKKCGPIRVILYEVALLTGVFIWAYSGWCLNYARLSLVERVGADRAHFDSLAFRNFLNTFTEEANESYVSVGSIDEGKVEVSVKYFYKTVPGRYGLCQPKEWQHVKPMPFSGIMSSMGVLGYIGPFFDEVHLNKALLPLDYPFDCAHEFSHLLGVSSEAEANWWAFHCCRSSSDSAIRYSAYLNMLPHVFSNAAHLLPEEEFRIWAGSIRPEIMEDYKNHFEYWSTKKVKILYDVQGWVYDLFLRGNGMPSGIKNYSEVVGMLVGVEYI